MAKFNPEEYETVESRIRKFYELHEDGRIITEWESSYAVDGASPNIWVVKATVYLTSSEQANKLPKATGYAFEKDGTGGANNTSALENAETSAIGRALANMNLSGNKRASREEMQKVERLSRDWLGDAAKLSDVNALRLLWAEAQAAKVSQDILDTIKEKASNVSNSVGSGSGDKGSVRSSNPEKASK